MLWQFFHLSGGLLKSFGLACHMDWRLFEGYEGVVGAREEGIRQRKPLIFALFLQRLLRLFPLRIVVFFGH